jgi:glycosyltransferase involved in cell wall biosynthesis
MISTSYPADAGDWRGIFIRHIAAAIARLPDATLSLWAPPGDLPPCVEPATTCEESTWLSGLMQAGGISHLMRTHGVRGATVPLKLLRMLWSAYRRPSNISLYHINWLQCALPVPRNGKPLLVSVLGNDLNLLRIPFVRQALRFAFRHRRVALCPNAEWMQPILEAAFGDLVRVVPVSFGIDDTWYNVTRRDVGTNNWLVVTRLTANKLGPLFAWAEPVFRAQGRSLHLFGPMQEPTEIPEWVHWHGPATPEELAKHWYPDARGLITLSVHAEGRPQTMLEAAAAGLPIIASDMPAHATIVQDDVTGRLCRDPASFAAAILALEDDATNRCMGEAARRFAKDAFGTWDDAAGRYDAVYRWLLGEGDAGGIEP